MKFRSLGFLVLLLLMCVPSVLNAQTGATRGTDSTLQRDSEAEAEALHNLDAARLYFNLRKAYVASLSRAEEIAVGYPNFSKIDEVLYIAGMSSFYLAKNKGKQNAKLYTVDEGETKRPFTTEEFRAEARKYLERLVKKYPESEFHSKAEKTLRELDAMAKK